VEKLWKGGAIVCFVTLNLNETHENLKPNNPFLEDGCLPGLGDAALISRGNSVE
jgi:hypothetical protein